MNRYLVLFLLLLCGSGSHAFAVQNDAIRLRGLTVEHLQNPIQLDIPEPRLSWKIETTDKRVKNVLQQSYRILVASSADMLSNHQGDLWDSGLVQSAQSVLVQYKGRRLHSRQACYWKVQITDNHGHKSNWSEPARWEMALLKPADWSGSAWIGYQEKTRNHKLASRKHIKLKEDLQSHTSPLLRQEVDVNKPVRKATAYVSGIGYSEFYINGNKIGDHVLDPGQTNYEKHTLYVVHDVTDAIRLGTNCLGLWLGNGFYGQNIGFAKKFGYGRPSARAKVFVEYTDGTSESFGTNKNWKATASPIVFDNVYWGETYDARLEIPNWSKPGLDDSNWQAAINVPTPCADDKLRPQLLPPIKAVERIRPVEIRQVEPGTWLLDYGKNISGWVEFTVKQDAGDVIKVFPAEVLTKDTKRADQVTMGGAPGGPHELYYVCKGNGEESWAPRFTYGGFQYVEVSGLANAPDANNMEAVFVRSAVEKTGSFSCSNDLLNKQYQASLLSLEGNWHSFPEDCPHREKCGWLGDAHATADLSLYNYDMARFYSKYMRDIQDSLRIDQKAKRKNRNIRAVPTMVAPGKRSNRVATVDWGVAYLILPWQMYLHTGDAEAFKPHFEHVKDFITYYGTFKNKQGVIDNGLGDWCPPRWDRKNAPEFMECHPFVSGTAFYCQALQIAGQMAEVLGDTDYSRQCFDQVDEIRTAFNKVYLKTIEGSKLKHFGSQTATVMALKLGMVPEAEIDDRVSALLFDINEAHDGHHACGIHGLRHLYTLLADHGHDELAFKMLTDTTFPSPGYVLSCGLSTWPERRFEWKKVRYSNSFNHPMNGGFTAFMHESLGGIRPDPTKPGYQHVRLKPQLTQQLEWVKASIESPYGPIRSEWNTDAESFTWEVEVPANATATLLIPCSGGQTIMENGRSIDAKTELISEPRQHWRQLKVGSGIYRFIVK